MQRNLGPQLLANSTYGQLHRAWFHASLASPITMITAAVLMGRGKASRIALPIGALASGQPATQRVEKERCKERSHAQQVTTPIALVRVQYHRSFAQIRLDVRGRLEAGRIAAASVERGRAPAQSHAQLVWQATVASRLQQRVSPVTKRWAASGELRNGPNAQRIAELASRLASLGARAASRTVIVVAPGQTTLRRAPPITHVNGPWARGLLALQMVAVTAGCATGQ